MEQPFWIFTFLKCTGLPDFSCHIPPSENLGSSYPLWSNLLDTPVPTQTHTHLWSGNRFLPLEGQTWFQCRWILTPAFHHDILKSSVGLVAYSVQLMVLSPPLSHLHISQQAQSTVPSQADISIKHPSDRALQNNALNPRDRHITH